MKKTISFIVCALALLVALAGCGQGVPSIPISATTADASPNEMLGERLVEVAATRGEAFLVRDGQMSELEEGMQLIQGDTIETGPTGYVIITMDSNKEVYVDSSSIMVLSVSAELGDADITMLLLKDGGILNYIDEKLPEDEIYEVYTETSVMGIRGTVVSVHYDAATKASIVRFLHGAGVVDTPDKEAWQPIQVGQEAVGEVDALAIRQYEWDSLTKLETAFLNAHEEIHQGLETTLEQTAPEGGATPATPASPSGDSSHSPPAQQPSPAPTPPPEQQPPAPATPIAPVPSPSGDDDADGDDGGDDDDDADNDDGDDDG